MLLEVRDLTINYGKVEAVKSVSISVEEGEIITLIGANGAGKTTILKAISGIRHSTSGEIWYKNERIDVLAMEKVVRLGIAHVPEGRRLFPLMTVLDTLKTGTFLIKDRMEIDKNLERVYKHFPRLKERSGQMAETLSGGEQQMLAIGRALMAGPKLLLLDEPSLGLAPLLVREIAQIIRDINQQGVTIVLVEQNSHMALRLADRGYVLQTGRIILEGESKELLNNRQVKEAYLGG